MLNLNLGAGGREVVGFLSIDRSSLTNPDIVHDLEDIPYPFADSSVDEILASHVLEHLSAPFEVMKELHRLLKNEGILKVRVPHFSRGFSHAEHKAGFDVTFPKYFDPRFITSGYVGVAFELVEIKLKWYALDHLAPYYGIPYLVRYAARSLNYLISGLANLAPLVCSRLWCFWVGGFDEIEFEFRCRKITSAETI